MTNWRGIRNKSFTLPGVAGGELVISETTDRDAIEITVRRNGVPNLPDELSVRLNAAQFEALCRMDSSYDGLQVEKPEPEVEVKAQPLSDLEISR
jgi:hypothetical protein